MLPETIEGVLDELDSIITRERRRNSRIAYFAVLYRNVTARVKTGIENGRFDDADRMERFDVIFANRYINAVHRYRVGDEKPSRCWRKAFEVADWWSPLILQHLLLGINAHINYDLGIAAARACTDQPLGDFRSDFFEINDLLEEMLDDIQARLASVSPWMGILDYIGCRTDEQIAGFCLSTARRVAWKSANKLASAERDRWGSEMNEIDLKAAAVTAAILKPTFFGQPAVLAIRLREPNDVGVVVRALRSDR